MRGESAVCVPRGNGDGMQYSGKNVSYAADGGENREENGGFCTECGAPLSPGQKYCGRCGSRTGQTGENSGHGDGENRENGTCGQGYGAHGAGRKSAVLAAVLAFVTGAYGIHNFYLGYTERGVWQAALSCGGWAMLVIPFFGWIAGPAMMCAAGIWGLYDGIIILSGGLKTDASGMPLDR